MAGWTSAGLQAAACHTAGKRHMGKKDTVGKLYFKDPERFAELLNAVLYRGEKTIKPEDLVPMEREYPSLSGKADKHRDVFMKDVRRQILYSLELETGTDYSMPERIMVYDACEYERQIRAITAARETKLEKGGYPGKKSRLLKEDLLIPVITLVLYLGNGRWKGRRNLSELFPVSAEEQNLPCEKFSGYTFYLAEADHVNAQDYETDLREFFQAMQCRRDKKKLRELFHSERFRNLSTLAALAIAVHIDRQGLAYRIEKEGIPMCQAFDELMEDMREKGIKEGGQRERISIIRQMLREGLERSLIIKVVKCSDEELAMAAEQ